METNTLRIGCVGGQARRVNERVIDDQWTRYLSEHAELVRIPPLAFLKLFGGSVQKWSRRLPESLDELASGLAALCAAHQVRTIYVNMPMLIPYLLMARNHAGLDLGLLFVAHSVGSEHWLKQWICIAPFVTERDVLLSSTASCTEALLRISPRYAGVTPVPLCIEMREEQPRGTRAPELLAIGRLEDVKNIDVLLECFAAIRKQVPDARLMLAGEYTGQTQEQTAAYEQQIQQVLERFALHDHVSLLGPVVGEQKEECFKKAALLVNLSTDPGETFGFNLLEAKTYGLPVVCTNWDGFAEVVEDGVDGFLAGCDWSGDRPVIDKEQVVRFCVEVLQDASLRGQLSQAAWQNAKRYDYKTVMPRIVEAVRERSAHAVSPSPAGELAVAPIGELSSVLHLSNLQQADVLTKTPVELLGTESTTPLSAWYPLCKPIIRHFARGRNDA